MIHDFKLEIKLKDTIALQLRRKNDEYFLVIKKLMKMIEHPRLIYLANRMLHFDKKFLNHEDLDGHMNIQDKQLIQQREDDKLFEDYSPKMKKILLEAIRDQRTPQVLSYSPQNGFNGSITEKSIKHKKSNSQRRLSPVNLLMKKSASKSQLREIKQRIDFVKLHKDGRNGSCLTIRSRNRNKSSRPSSKPSMRIVSNPSWKQLKQTTYTLQPVTPKRSERSYSPAYNCEELGRSRINSALSASFKNKVIQQASRDYELTQLRNEGLKTETDSFGSLEHTRNRCTIKASIISRRPVSRDQLFKPITTKVSSGSYSRLKTQKLEPSPVENFDL